MNWKPIPKEAPEAVPKKKTHIRAKFVCTKFSNCELPGIPYRLFQKVSLKLLDFIKKEKKYSPKDISLLINEMQQTITKLQKKRFFLIEKQLNPLFKLEENKHRKNNRYKNSGNN